MFLFVAVQLITQIYTKLLRSRRNLTLQISQGSASTYFRWSGQFRYSFVEGLFRDSSYNFYWNRFRPILDRQGAKYMLAQFQWDTVYSMVLLISIILL